MTSTSLLAQRFSSVKVNILPAQVEEAIHRTYSRQEGAPARERLAQGELDVLESCRQALGWKTITSLAVKYYPLFPERHSWKRALALSLRYRARWHTATLSIRYLLKAVIQQHYESLVRNFSGKLTEIKNNVSPILNSIPNHILNRKGVWGKTYRHNKDDLDQFIRGKYGHMVRR